MSTLSAYGYRFVVRHARCACAWLPVCELDAEAGDVDCTDFTPLQLREFVQRVMPLSTVQGAGQ